ncbi:MAG: hypothetical protein COA86_15755 [Kangiella sp.]|nr:MAG: hypothetical protein COA86_15755 [Kangiella sp.]
MSAKADILVKTKGQLLKNKVILQRLSISFQVGTPIAYCKLYLIYFIDNFLKAKEMKQMKIIKQRACMVIFTLGLCLVGLHEVGFSKSIAPSIASPNSNNIHIIKDCHI